MIFWYIIYFVFSVGGLTLFKIGTTYTPIAFFQKLCGLKLSLFSLGGLACYSLSFLTYLFLVSKTEMSYLYPIVTGVSCILIMLVSAVVLRESIHPLNWLGVAVIMIGLLLVNYGRH